MYVFGTHPPLIYVLISYVKEIMFWNRYPSHPPFKTMSQNTQGFFEGFRKRQDIKTDKQWILFSGIDFNTWYNVFFWNIQFVISSYSTRIYDMISRRYIPPSFCRCFKFHKHFSWNCTFHKRSMRWTAKGYCLIRLGLLELFWEWADWFSHGG